MDDLDDCYEAFALLGTETWRFCAVQSHPDCAREEELPNHRHLLLWEGGQAFAGVQSHDAAKHGIAQAPHEWYEKRPKRGRCQNRGLMLTMIVGRAPKNTRPVPPQAATRHCRAYSQAHLAVWLESLEFARARFFISRPHLSNHPDSLLEGNGHQCLTELFSASPRGTQWAWTRLPSSTSTRTSCS